MPNLDIREFNITAWPEFGVNFWGIPKCGNTSVKIALYGIDKDRSVIEGKQNANTFYRVNSKWVHELEVVNYIVPEEALENGLNNLTVIRNPLDRLNSQFFYNFRAKILKITYVDQLLDHVEMTSELDRNMHFRSQKFFIAENSKLLVDKIFKLEHIQELENFLGIQIPITNQSMAKLTFTKQQISRIKKLYKEDFDLYETR